MNKRPYLTQEEKAAIASLRRLATKWPDSLWLFSGSGSLHVIKKTSDGKRALNEFGGMDATHSVAVIDIENDGGDW